MQSLFAPGSHKAVGVSGQRNSVQRSAITVQWGQRRSDCIWRGILFI